MTTATYCQRLRVYRWYTRVVQQRWGGAMWRPISWRARKTHVTRDVGAQAGVKTLTMILYVRSLFIIKSALLETGHVSRSQIVWLVSKRYMSNNVDISQIKMLIYSLKLFQKVILLLFYVILTQTPATKNYKSFI